MKSAILGCGSIGALKPSKYDYPGGKNILTHAHAYHDHPETTKEFILHDNNYDQRLKASGKWICYIAENLEKIKNYNPDIISLCVPTKHHLSTMHEIIDAAIRPKVVIAEKPFGENSVQAVEMAELAEEYNFKYVVDYIRRFDPVTQKISEHLRDGFFGKIHNCRVVYNRGLKHEACHAIDLCRYFFGEYLEGYILQAGAIDELEGDTSFPAILRFENCPNVYLTPTDGRDYSIFEIDIFTEKGRINFFDHGKRMALYGIEPEETYGDYNALSMHPEIKKTELTTALYNLVDHAIQVIKKPDTPIICTADDAIAVHKIYEALSV